MEDANLIVRVDIEPKKQKVSKGAKAAAAPSLDHLWIILGPSVAKLPSFDRTDSKFQICQAIENLMSKSDREVLEARPWPRPLHMAAAFCCPGHGSGRMGGHGHVLCC